MAAGPAVPQLHDMAGEASTATPSPHKVTSSAPYLQPARPSILLVPPHLSGCLLPTLAPGLVSVPLIYTTYGHLGPF